ncbi:hypothetical protein F4556_001174 [Kitasatospora gansuensis]|uniref:Sortase n=1 Tax=Kitasatospora gansuensis TaxID=258050 RepID=A0A7W7S878_9ACTN|nr:hypothetical protein [Kitasatospora gansuensis]MBB4945639.1 hypothetical protein [Kitasatospora gansuensis]
MRASRTATTLLGAAALLGIAAGSASAKSVEPAWVHPAETGPGQSVTVSVTCETSSVKTITANSQAFSTGSATLTVGPDGKYSGKALLASKEEFASKAGRSSSWGIDGSCPNGDTFTGAVEVQAASHAGGGKLPTGPVKTGLGGSVRTDPADLVAGGALVSAGVGGFWLLRRRTAL